MRHPAGTIWRAHRDSTRAREGYNTRAVFAPLLPSVLSTRADSDSKAETNFADFSIADEECLLSCDLREQFPRLFSTSNIYLIYIGRNQNDYVYFYGFFIARMILMILKISI